MVPSLESGADPAHRPNRRAGSARVTEIRLRHIEKRRLHRFASKSELIETESDQIFGRPPSTDFGAVSPTRPGLPPPRATKVVSDQGGQMYRQGSHRNGVGHQEERGKLASCDDPLDHHLHHGFKPNLYI